MWHWGDEQKRDELIAHVNNQLNVVGFQMGRGWMNYDPVIRRVRGKPSSYAEIVSWASRHADSGRQAAQLFLNWATDLPAELQDLAIITHLAEVGRGYQISLENELYPLVRSIASGSKSWSDYHEYSPSLNFAEDSRSDYP